VKADLHIERRGVGGQTKQDPKSLDGVDVVRDGSGDQRQNAMLMILLAQSCMLLHGFVWYLALNGPKSDPNFLSPIPKETIQRLPAAQAHLAVGRHGIRVKAPTPCCREMTDVGFAR